MNKFKNLVELAQGDNVQLFFLPKDSMLNWSQESTKRAERIAIRPGSRRKMTQRYLQARTALEERGDTHRLRKSAR